MICLLPSSSAAIIQCQGDDETDRIRRTKQKIRALCTAKQDEWRRRVWSTSGNSLRQLTYSLLLLNRIAILFVCFPRYVSAHPIPSCCAKGSDQHPSRAAQSSAEFLISQRKQRCEGVPLHWIRKRDNDRFLSSHIAKRIIRNDKYLLLSTTWPFQYCGAAGTAVQSYEVGLLLLPFPFLCSRPELFSSYFKWWWRESLRKRIELISVEGWEILDVHLKGGELLERWNKMCWIISMY